MMTSYFSKCGLSKEAVAISRTVPKWYRGRRCMKLAPPFWMIRIKDPGVFERLYRDQVLSRLDARRLYEELGDDAILLCWEADASVCHRRIVAGWFQSELGIEVPEYEGDPL